MFPHRNPRLLTLVRIVAAAVITLATAGAWAQSYPSRPLTLLVPYTAGGSTDLVGRFLAVELTKKLGQQVVVENKPGATGIVGAVSVVRAPADGYTMFFGDLATLATHPHLHKQLGYDPLTDFVPVTLVVRFPMVFVVNAAVPAKSLQEFVSLAKSRAEPMFFGSIGPGSLHLMAMERVKLLTGMKLTHVSYNGGSPANRALIAGEIQAMMLALGPLAEHVRSGQIRPLATASASRMQAFPDVPTFDEAGIKGFEMYAWFGIVMAARTDQSIVARLNNEIRQILSVAETRERFSKLGMETISSSPEQFKEYIKQEYAVWGQIIEIAKLRID